MLATVASRCCSGVIPGSGGPVGCGTDEPPLALEDGPAPAAVELPPVTPSTEEAPLSGAPVPPGSPLASVAAALEGSELEPLEALELEVSEASEALELELLEDPPPQPANASAATASTRKALALAVFAGLTRKRLSTGLCATQTLR